MDLLNEYKKCIYKLGIRNGFINENEEWCMKEWI